MARAARRAGRLAGAGLLIVAGTAMLVLPGPGLVTLGVGLGLMGPELGWSWVQRLEKRFRGNSTAGAMAD